MNKNILVSISILLLVCLLFTACDKDEIVHPPMEWTWDIQTSPENVKYEDSDPGASSIYFKANGMEGDLVLTCKNYDNLCFAEMPSESYDCGWATIRIDANKIRIHFPYNVSDAPTVSENITIIGLDGTYKASSIIGLTRTFESGEQSAPDAVPDAAKFKMIKSGLYPFLDLDTRLPAPFDLITFRITDINGKYTPAGMPEFTQYYDSIVWCAEKFPHSFRIYDKKMTAAGKEQHFISQWSSYFFKSGTIKTHLKGYLKGDVIYETPFNLFLYERDFLGIKWGPIVLSNPKNLTTYCRLDSTYEYQVNDIIAKGDAPFSEIFIINHKQLPDADYLLEAQKAIKTLMETNVGFGQYAKGKESLFKCLPENNNVEAELFWENKTCRIVMLHQIPDDPEEITQENYYLHIEPK